MPNIKYRADVDGLRALAVVLVIANHFGLNVPGGYIGVDVFFVISGFVITLGIYPQIVAGTFTFKDFWYRRLRRLMPVFFFVMFACLLVFHFLLTPSDLSLFLKNIIAANFSVSNIFIWREYGGYFEGAVGEAPLLHTWSLAVEEQFYLIWPLTLVILCRFLKLPWLLAVLGIVWIISLLVSQVGVERTFSAAYYLMPTRFFELLAGAFLAIVFNTQNLRFHPLLQHLLSLLGLGLILFASFHLHPGSAFPGYNALLPVVGTCFIILSTNGVVNTLFALRPIVRCGQMSYSLYLWHWPAIVVLIYMDIGLTGLNGMVIKVLAISIVFILSYVSWRYVENPFRHKDYKSFGQLFIRVFALPSLVLSGISAIGIYNSGFPARFDSEVALMDTALNSDPNKHSCLATHREYMRAIPDKCRVSPPRDKIAAMVETPLQKRGLLFGDSHANHLNRFTHIMAAEKNIEMHEYTMSTCPPLIDINYGRSEYQYSRCRARNDALKDYLTKGYDYLVVSATWPRPTSALFFDDQGKRIEDVNTKEKLLRKGLENLVALTQTQNTRLIIVLDTPGTGQTNFACPIKRALFDAGKSCLATRPINHWFNDILESVVSDRARIVDLRDVLCKETICLVDLQAIPLYRDSGHLNEHGSEIIGRVYSRNVGNIFRD